MDLTRSQSEGGDFLAWRYVVSSFSGLPVEDTLLLASNDIYSSSPKNTLTGSHPSPQTLKRSGSELRDFVSSSVNDQPALVSTRIVSCFERLTV